MRLFAGESATRCQEAIGWWSSCSGTTLLAMACAGEEGGSVAAPSGTIAAEIPGFTEYRSPTRGYMVRYPAIER